MKKNKNENNENDTLYDIVMSEFCEKNIEKDIFGFLDCWIVGL